MTNVSYVDLSKNQLYELSPESLDGIDGVVEHLDLMENPWHCNCSIHWMRKVRSCSKNAFTDAVATDALLENVFLPEVQENESVNVRQKPSVSSLRRVSI